MSGSDSNHCRKPATGGSTFAKSSLRTRFFRSASGRTRNGRGCGEFGSGMSRGHRAAPPDRVPVRVRGALGVLQIDEGPAVPGGEAPRMAFRSDSRSGTPVARARAMAIDTSQLDTLREAMVDRQLRARGIRSRLVLE